MPFDDKAVDALSGQQSLDLLKSIMEFSCVALPRHVTLDAESGDKQRKCLIKMIAGVTNQISEGDAQIRDAIASRLACASLSAKKFNPIALGDTALAPLMGKASLLHLKKVRIYRKRSVQGYV